MTDKGTWMVVARTRAVAASLAPLARAGLIAALAGCSSSSNGAGPPAPDGGIDASTASDGSVADTGAGKTGRTLELTWQVVVGAPSRPYAGYDGGAGAGGGIDAGSDDAGLDASGASGDAAPDDAVADAPRAPDDAGWDVEVADASGALADAKSDGRESSGAPDAGDIGAMPVEGLQVCVYQSASIPCVMTDSTGKFTIGGLPAMSDIVISLKKAGYRPTLLAIETGSTNMDGSAAGPYPISRLVGSPSSSPVAVDLSTKGAAVFFAIGPALVGALGTMVSLSPTGGDGPYFVDDAGALDPSATSVLTKSGIYFNLDPGTYQMTFDEPDHDCASLSIPFGFGFSTSLPNSVKFPIVAGYQTGPVGVICTPASVLVNTADAY
jgi:hypothetical protein